MMTLTSFSWLLSSLKKEGAQVITARDGMEGVSKLFTQSPGPDHFGRDDARHEWLRGL